MTRFKRSARYEGQGGKLPQPIYDSTKPHQHYPAAAYKRVPEPPVRVAAE